MNFCIKQKKIRRVTDIKISFSGTQDVEIGILLLLFPEIIVE
jgi:hypothetical protein